MILLGIVNLKARITCRLGKLSESTSVQCYEIGTVFIKFSVIYFLRLNKQHV